MNSRRGCDNCERRPRLDHGSGIDDPGALNAIDDRFPDIQITESVGDLSRPRKYGIVKIGDLGVVCVSSPNHLLELFLIMGA